MAVGIYRMTAGHQLSGFSPLCMGSQWHAKQLGHKLRLPLSTTSKQHRRPIAHVEIGNTSVFGGIAINHTARV